MKCRKNVRNLTELEKRDFARACMGLKGVPSVLHPGSQSRYDDYAELHLDAMNSISMWAHMGPAFFPWHRELMYRFEKDLQTIVPGVRIPYWDWTRHRSTTDAGFPFTNDFLGRDGDPADSDRVKRDPAVPLNSNGTYPFEFDPNNWTLTLDDNSGPGVPPNPAFLTRDFGSNSTARQLPVNDLPIPAGTQVNSTYRQAISAADYSALRSRSESNHNLVHRWVEGAMGSASSPNDMVFWLHHAAIDRMWSIWQAKQPVGTPLYIGNATYGQGLNDPLIFQDSGQPAPWPGAGEDVPGSVQSGAATPQDMINHHAIHGDGVWYETDVPEIALDSGPTLAFGSVPEGLTIFRAVRFRVRTGRVMRFRITAAPTGNFGLTPVGTEFTVEPDEAADFLVGQVWLQFRAIGASAQSSGVVIAAYFVDDEGYYAPVEGGEFSIGSWSVNLTAGVVPRANNAVVMVLDRSGSMSTAAGGSSTRTSLLRSAVGVFHALMLPTDEVGVVSFDDVVETPLPLTTQNAGLGNLLTGSSLDPRGLTAIGLGIQAGAPILSASSHTNRSMLVLTDGNQNVHPFVEELPAGTIVSRTFSIGFGLPGQVSDTVLNAIASNTGGYFLVTGNLSQDEELFLLTKYFVQVLAGATNMSIILDPEGHLGWGDQHMVEFDVGSTDVGIDVIALCPAAGALEFVLVTPGGQTITPAIAAAEPNISFSAQEDVAFYRLVLPALPAGGGSHQGKWRAVFQLRKPKEVQAWLAEHGRSLAMLTSIKTGALPYSLSVHAYSNLRLHAACFQEGFKPGSKVFFEATLLEYGVPLGSGAVVWADVTRPDGSGETLTFTADRTRGHAATFGTSSPGVYRFRVRATGATSAGHPFTREKLMSVGVFADGLDGGQRGSPGDVTGQWGETLCRVLLCLSGPKVIDDRLEKKLREHGIDLDALRECLTRWCDTMRHGRESTHRGEAPLEVRERDVELLRKLKSLDPEDLFAKASEPMPLKRAERKPKRRAPAPKGGHFPPLLDQGAKGEPDTGGHGGRTGSKSKKRAKRSK